MRWPWGHGRHRARGRPGEVRPNALDPSGDEPVDEPRRQPIDEARRQLAEADERLRETEARWPTVARKALTINRLNRENRFGILIDKALGSGPT